MVRFKKLPLRENEGKIIYDTNIVDDIVLLAVSEIPFVKLHYAQSKTLRSDSVKVTNEKDGIHVDVIIDVHYSQAISDIAFKIQEAIRYNVESMTEYKIGNVNVIVLGVFFDDEGVRIVEKNENTHEDKTENQ